MQFWAVKSFLKWNEKLWVNKWLEKSLYSVCKGARPWLTRRWKCAFHPVKNLQTLYLTPVFSINAVPVKDWLEGFISYIPVVARKRKSEMTKCIIWFAKMVSSWIWRVPSSFPGIAVWQRTLRYLAFVIVREGTMSVKVKPCSSLN